MMFGKLVPPESSESGSESSESEEHVERGPNDTDRDYVEKLMDNVHKRTYRREIKDYIKKKNLKKIEGES